MKCLGLLKGSNYEIGRFFLENNYKRNGEIFFVNEENIVTLRGKYTNIEFTFIKLDGEFHKEYLRESLIQDIAKSLPKIRKNNKFNIYKIYKKYKDDIKLDLHNDLELRISKIGDLNKFDQQEIEYNKITIAECGGYILIDRGNNGNIIYNYPIEYLFGLEIDDILVKTKYDRIKIMKNILKDYNNIRYKTMITLRELFSIHSIGNNLCEIFSRDLFQTQENSYCLAKCKDSIILRNTVYPYEKIGHLLDYEIHRLFKFYVNVKTWDNTKLSDIALEIYSLINISF